MSTLNKNGLTVSSNQVITSINDLSGLSETIKERWNLWIYALRSGKYGQTKAQLRSAQGNFCCLGVAADIADKSCGQWLPQKSKLVWQDGGNPQQRDGDNMTSSLLDYYGFDKDRSQLLLKVRFEGSTRSCGLVHLNDSFGLPFTDIADIMELALKGGLDVDPT
jgi:hypothetical protein